MKQLNDLQKLSKGEHKLEDVLKMSGLEEADPFLTEDGFCSKCGELADHEEEFTGDNPDGSGSVSYFICPKCRHTLREKRYCVDCGIEITEWGWRCDDCRNKICSHCGEELPHQHCTKCGEPIKGDDPAQCGACAVGYI